MARPILEIKREAAEAVSAASLDDELALLLRIVEQEAVPDRLLQLAENLQELIELRRQGRRPN
jgi:hypothetical protein